MTNAQLEAKFHGLSDPVLGSAATSGLLTACWKLGAAPDVANVIRHATPA
jgi:hypothetical protein